jgi:hypothetical protein
MRTIRESHLFRAGSGTLMRETNWNWRAKLDNDQSWPSKMAYLLEKEVQTKKWGGVGGEHFFQGIRLVTMWDM